MITRTNLRTWRSNATYIIQVGLRGSETNPHIYAELKAIAIDTMSKIVLIGELTKYLAGDELFSVNDQSTAQKAIDEAIKQFKSAKNIH